MSITDFLKSKTFWAGVLVALGIVGQALASGGGITIAVLSQALGAILGGIGIKAAIVKAGS